MVVLGLISDRFAPPRWAKTGWHHYLAFDGAQPVAAAAMFARRIQDGLALGGKWFVTETGEETPDSPNSSSHNMQRAGFELAYLRRNFIHQPQKTLKAPRAGIALLI